MLNLLTDYSFRVVAIGTILLGMASAMVGTYSYLRHQSLLTDALSHAALPGIVLAFMLTGVKNHLLLLLGASISGLIATVLIHYLSRHKVKFDSALSIVLSGFFGLGLALLTYVSRQANANQAGLENYIFGQASAMLKSDVIILFFLVCCLVLIISIFWKEFKLLSFDPVQAHIHGYNVQFLQTLLGIILVVVVVMGLQSVGVVLMSAFIVIPPTAARQWTNRLSTMMSLAIIFGSLSSFLGTLMSAVDNQIPTGPSIVLFASIFLALSLLFAPHRGFISRFIHNYRRRNKLKQHLKEGGALDGSSI